MQPTDFIDKASLRDDIPDFGPGDTLKVHARVVEGNKERIQVLFRSCVFVFFVMFLSAFSFVCVCFLVRFVFFSICFVYSLDHI